MDDFYRIVFWTLVLCHHTWSKALALTSECNGELGMESKKIPDENITSSSELSSNHTAAFARLDGRRAWCSAPEDDSPYIQIQLDEEKSITSIKTQGSYYDFSWARNYEVRYLKEGKWTSYNEELHGNRNSRSWHRNEFHPPIRTRSIRIYPKDPLAVMMDITVPCLRLELYGCTAPALCPDPAKIAHGSYSGSDFSEGSTVIYTCDDQYFLKGSSSITCANGQWNASPPVCREAFTCKNIYDNNFSSGNKAYLLRIGSGTIPVYCHMTSGELGACGGGGWTLVMKIDGSQRTFHYDSLLWSDKSDFNLAGGKTGFDAQETKLPTYWNTSFSEICLGMKFRQQIRSFVINKHASSLHSLIADGKYHATSHGRDTWKELIGSQASLQTHCNREGFNILSNLRPWSKARIGILANNEDECDSCDSRIGFGTGGHHDDSNTCGNQASHSGDNGDQHIKVIGYILVK